MQPYEKKALKPSSFRMTTVVNDALAAQTLLIIDMLVTTVTDRIFLLVIADFQLK